MLLKIDLDYEIIDYRKALPHIHELGEQAIHRKYFLLLKYTGNV